jgi:hypothetical protein
VSIKGWSECVTGASTFYSSDSFMCIIIAEICSPLTETINWNYLWTPSQYCTVNTHHLNYKNLPRNAV